MSSTRHSSGNGSRAMIGAGRSHGAAPAVERQAALAGRSPVPRPERAPRSSSSASASTSSASPCRPRSAAATASASCVPEPSPACAGMASRIDDAVTDRQPEMLGESLRQVRPPAPPAARSRCSPGVRLSSSNCLRRIERQPEAAEAPAQAAVQIEKTEMQARRRPKLSRSLALPGSSRDFAAEGGLFGRPRPRIMVRHGVAGPLWQRQGGRSTMSERASERTYSDAEVEERLKTRAAALEAGGRLDPAQIQDGQLEGHADGDQHRRPPRRGRLAPPRHHRLLRLGRGAADEPRRQGHHRQGFRARQEDRGGRPVAARRRRAARSRGRRAATSASPTSNTTPERLQRDRAAG